MQNKKQKLAIIHVAKKELSLTEEAYRALLASVGVDSAKDLQTDGQFNELMDAFDRLGFKNKRRAQYPFKERRKGGGKNRLTDRQEYYIRGLWDLASRTRNEKSLNAFVKRITGVVDISWLTVQEASKIILALRKICEDAGYNPNTKLECSIRG